MKKKPPAPKEKPSPKKPLRLPVASLPPSVDPGARERLLQAATEVFAQKGYATATVREIVEAAGVTKPVLYYYFGSKEGLYLALMQEAFSGLKRLLLAAKNEGGNVRERILDLCDGAYTFTSTHLSLVRVMYAIYYGPPQGAPPFDFEATHLLFQQELQTLIEEGVASGEMRALPPGEAMWAVIGALNIAIEVDLCHPEDSLGREGLRRLVSHLFDGLAVPGARPANKGARR